MSRQMLSRDHFRPYQFKAIIAMLDFVIRLIGVHVDHAGKLHVRDLLHWQALPCCTLPVFRQWVGNGNEQTPRRGHAIGVMTLARAGDMPPFTDEAFAPASA